ncbi:response regulator [Roseomonas sp. HJA6]|uniref:Response regulator n=1 Tax=Roseomonas alba TaxID=2846776 RepID=A0ABS7AG86_9PROT|nr:response regulator [Neoroseomonas alba]MBW6401320.1 response regulator [Neoroseomonas alba]
MQDSIVYDDWRIREAIVERLAAIGSMSCAFQSIDEYLKHPRPDALGCLVLDVELPGIDGLDFQEQAKDGHPPIIFLTGHGDIPSSVRAIKAGAVNFLTKPFNSPELPASIDTAVVQDHAARREREERSAPRARHATLTAREREVLPLVVSGLLNKQAAAELGISEVTMQIHRGRVMQKMQAASIADLVRSAHELGIPINHSRRRDD